MKRVFLVCLACGLALLSGAALAAESTDDGFSMEHRIDLGYRGVSVNGNGNRAAEYSDHDSGPVGALDLKGYTGGTHILIDGAYESKNDYNADAHVDVSGKFKLNLHSERLWHNLDHIPYDYPAQPEAREPAQTSAGTTRAVFIDQNPDADYGLRVERDSAEAILKMGDYPGHVKLQYWRWQQKGSKQLRFVEEGHDDPAVAGTCNVCHVQSKTRELDRVTEELSGSVDAHVGLLELEYKQLYRQFRVSDPIPVDNFNGHNYGPAGGADFQHSEDPESRLFESTVKARTALSGGLVGEAAYTYGRRENQSEMAAKPLGVDGIYAVSEYNKTAGDLTWTPNEFVTATFRYRMLDLDSNNADTLVVDYNVVDKTFPVRDSMDLRRTEYSGSLAWRPSYLLTIKGDYNHEWLTRGNTGGPLPNHGSQAALPTGAIDSVWELPAQEAIDTLRLAFTARPLGTSELKLRAWYKYATSSDPAYGTSFNSKHEVFASAHYKPRKANWGVSASGRVTRELLDDHLGYTFDSVDNPVPLLSDRERWHNTLNAGYWINPSPRTTAGFNYGYVRTNIVQDLKFGADYPNYPAPPTYILEDPDGTDILQQSHTLSAFVNWLLSDSVSCHLSGYVTKADAEYDPNFTDPNVPPLTLVADSTFLKEISRIDIRQIGGAAGIDWRPVDGWEIGLKYTADNYEAANNNSYDGTVQTGSLLLSKIW